MSIEPLSYKKLLITITLTLFIIPSLSSFILAHNRDATVDYASYFYDKVTSDGTYWVSQWAGKEKVESVAWSYPPGTDLSVIQDYLAVKNPGDWASTDCAHFVSSAIGSPPSYRGHSGGGLDVPDRADGYGEPGANKLINWAINKVGTEVDSIDKLKKGDIIGYDLDKDGYIDHTAVYLGDKKAAAHSSSWKGHWYLGYNRQEFEPTFVHITKEVGPKIPWRLLMGVGAAVVAIVSWLILQ
ncbi:hypothetical protein KGY77_10910 [Candidatus Bipolaricaulota bacterium]|nr:hypothetical protein [Candidatus Bipolaricaulota bacterium]